MPHRGASGRCGRLRLSFATRERETGAVLATMLAFLEGPDLIIVVVVVLLLFGSSQLPKFARSLGQAKKEFESGIRESESAPPAPAASPPAQPVIEAQAPPVLQAPAAPPAAAPVTPPAADPQHPQPPAV